MYPYTKVIDLSQAEALDRIAFKNSIEILAQNQQYQLNPVNICMWDFGDVYTKDKRVLFITAIDYATHILNQQAPPEGWGYAAYDYGTGRYNKLEFMHVNAQKRLYHFIDIENMANNWADYLFRLTDLARVEAETVGVNTDRIANNKAQDEFRADTDKTEINVAQIAWILHNTKKELQYYCNGASGFPLNGNSLIHKVLHHYTYELLNEVYSELPDEFKELAAPIPPSGIKPPLNCCPKCDETHQELTAKVADWEAKNKELANLGLTYAVDIANSDKYKERIAELEAKLDTTQKVCKSLLGQVERAKAYLEAVETKLSLIEKLEANKPKLEKAQVEYYRPKGYYSE
jgi:uncharacterized coiled-coil protein SlyX